MCTSQSAKPLKTLFPQHPPQVLLPCYHRTLSVWAVCAGALKASEVLKTTSVEIAALAAELPPGGHARSAVGALSLMGLDGLGAELRLALACADRALNAICQLHAAAKAGESCSAFRRLPSPCPCSSNPMHIGFHLSKSGDMPWSAYRLVAC